MPIKIFHTADLHIGMKFNSYPDYIRGKLQQARSEVLARMVQMANEENCSLFVIAGDLFHNIKGIDKKTIAHAALELEAFQGACVLVLPGNHDYDNEMIDFWQVFKQNAGEQIIFLNREEPVSLTDYGLNVTLYPAPCHSKHSDTSNVGWIEAAAVDPRHINIGLAHGSLQGISPDLDVSYYYMTSQELEGLPMDIWLLGHTHVVYPAKKSVKDWRIFNPGTPEPDGLDCRHHGHAWLITVDEQKGICAEQVETGIYRFVDETYTISVAEDLERLQGDLLRERPDKTIARIHLEGQVSEDVFNYRQEIIKKLEQEMAHVIFDDFNLGIKITPEKIEREFTAGSFPRQFLQALSADEDAMQIAYELIMGVKK